MLVARLHTARGYVATVEVPPFETGYPPVIAWGDRTFLRMSSSDVGEYMETFCFVATVEVRDVGSDRD